MLSKWCLQGFGVLNKSPLVLHTFRYLDDMYPGINALCAELQQKVHSGTILVSLGWSIVAQFNSPGFREFRQQYREFHGKFPGWKIVILANDRVEEALLSQLGIVSTLAQHNIFLTPKNFKLKNRDENKYDALYIARLHPYKRVELMSLVPNAALVSGSFDRVYYQQIQSRIESVSILNGLPDRDFVPLKREEVQSAIRSSRVGLCLSEIEGAMFGSAEYLLCGLPVVSTYCVGGRDSLACAPYWIPCDDTPEAVANAVRRAISLDADPLAVQTAAIQGIMAQRHSLVQFMRAAIFDNNDQPNHLYGRLYDINSTYKWTQYTVEMVLADL